MKMQKTLTVQRRNGNFEEMPEEMALDARLQKKHGWIVVNVPKTVEELKAVVHPFSVSNEQDIEEQEAVVQPLEDIELFPVTEKYEVEEPLKYVATIAEETEGVTEDGQIVQEVKKRGRKPRQ